MDKESKVVEFSKNGRAGLVASTESGSTSPGPPRAASFSRANLPSSDKGRFADDSSRSNTASDRTTRDCSMTVLPGSIPI